MQWVLLLAISAAWVPAARSQEQRERAVPQGTTVQLLLLRQKSVQEELKLPADVVAKVMDFTHKEHEAFHKVIKLPPEERRQKFAELRKENEQFLKDNLTPAQNKRLVQITLQVTGLHQLSRPEVALALGLTDDQKQKIEAIRKETHKKLAKVLQAKSPAERKEQLAKLREENREQIQALLTAEQKEKVKEVVGEPFRGEIVIEGPESAPEK
jgi:hypothetical protein